jgi:hypothetical protein
MEEIIMAGNVKEFIGITQNEAKFQGKVIGDPVIYGENCAVMTIRTVVSEPTQGGSWADVQIDVPVMATDPKKVVTVREYVKDGREILVDAYYNAWVHEGTPQHAFIIKKMVLGRKKYEPKPQG